MKVFIIGLPQSGRTTVAKAVSDYNKIPYYHHLLDDQTFYDSFTNNYCIIDGLSSPKDFVSLFDHNKDVVIFLNRTDNTSYFKEIENVAISVIKDYCYWLAACGDLAKDRWLEYNFKMIGQLNILPVKKLSDKNTVFIAKSVTAVISHLCCQINSIHL